MALPKNSWVTYGCLLRRAFGAGPLRAIRLGPGSLRRCPDRRAQGSEKNGGSRCATSFLLPCDPFPAPVAPSRLALRSDSTDRLGESPGPRRSVTFSHLEPRKIRRSNVLPPKTDKMPKKEASKHCPNPKPPTNSPEEAKSKFTTESIGKYRMQKICVCK